MLQVGRLRWGALGWVLICLASARAAETISAPPTDVDDVKAVTAKAFIVDPSVPMGQMSALQNRVLSQL